MQSPADRADLIVALNRAAREASGLGVLFGQTVAQRLGLNATDFECLDVIAMRTECTAGDLAAATGLTTGAVTGIIDRLEAAGFARRERDKEDRRKVLVRLLPKARRRAEAYYRAFGKAIDGLADKYTRAEIGLLIDYFSRTRAAILGQIERLKATHPAPAKRRR